MTPKEIYEWAKEHGVEEEDIGLYDGDEVWVLEEHQLYDCDKSLVIKQVGA